jgi:hypothetical protein
MDSGRFPKRKKTGSLGEAEKLLPPTTAPAVSRYLRTVHDERYHNGEQLLRSLHRHPTREPLHRLRTSWHVQNDTAAIAVQERMARE